MSAPTAIRQPEQAIGGYDAVEQVQQRLDIAALVEHVGRQHHRVAAGAAAQQVGARLPPVDPHRAGFAAAMAECGDIREQQRFR